MDGKIEQRVCIKFCVKLRKSATKTLEMLLEAFEEHSLSRTAVFEWYSSFKAGRVSVEDDEHPGRPNTSKTTENVEKIRELIHEDGCRTIHEVADTIGICYGDCQEILTENLNMRCIAVKCVPRLLTNDQKQQHVDVCFKLRQKANEDPTFISRIITGWICGYDPETKQQSSQWKSPQSPRTKKARQFNKEYVHCFFSDAKGIVHRESVPPNITVNSEFYCDVLRRLRENVRRKRSEL
jgi:hypothetical protein